MVALIIIAIVSDELTIISAVASISVSLISWSSSEQTRPVSSPAVSSVDPPASISPESAAASESVSRKSGFSSKSWLHPDNARTMRQATRTVDQRKGNRADSQRSRNVLATARRHVRPSHRFADVAGPQTSSSTSPPSRHSTRVDSKSSSARRWRPGTKRGRSSWCRRWNSFGTSPSASPPAPRARPPSSRCGPTSCTSPSLVIAVMRAPSQPSSRPTRVTSMP